MLFRTIAIIGGLALCAASARAGTAEEIEAVLRDPFLSKVKAGVHIVRLGGSRESPATIFERNATTPLIPASNLKVVTTAAALETFGPDFRYRTVLMQKGDALALIGDGDPSLGDSQLLRPVGWKSTTLFEKWAAALRERGLQSASELVIDDTIFDDTFVHPNWPTDQLHKAYVAGVGGLNFNLNCLDFYLTVRGPGERVDYATDPVTAYAAVDNNCVRGTKNAVWLSRLPSQRDIVLRGETPASNGEPYSVTIDNPPMFTGTVLRDAFARGGINMAGDGERKSVV